MGQIQSSCQPSLLHVCTLGSATQCYLNLMKGFGGGVRATLQDVSPVRPRNLPQTEGGPLLLHLLPSRRSPPQSWSSPRGLLQPTLVLLCCSVLNMSHGKLLWGCQQLPLHFPKGVVAIPACGRLTESFAHGWAGKTGGQEVVETDPRSQ